MTGLERTDNEAHETIRKWTFPVTAKLTLKKEKNELSLNLFFYFYLG